MLNYVAISRFELKSSESESEIIKPLYYIAIKKVKILQISVVTAMLQPFPFQNHLIGVLLGNTSCYFYLLIHFLTALSETP